MSHDIQVECARQRCKHLHMESQRTLAPRDRRGRAVKLCPLCGCQDYYRIPNNAPAKAPTGAVLA